MEYLKKNNKIVINKCDEFDPKHILECGQVFRYKLIENGYQVFSLDKTAIVLNTTDGYEIISDDIDYFENYFDLKTDYSSIKEQIKKSIENKKFMLDSLDYGKGIRILNAAGNGEKIPKD